MVCIMYTTFIHEYLVLYYLILLHGRMVMIRNQIIFYGILIKIAFIILLKCIKKYKQIIQIKMYCSLVSEYFS